MAQQAHDPTPYGSEKPLTELIKDLSVEVSTLIRQEVALAKAELAEKGKRAGIGAGLFGGAGVVALLALGAFTAFLIAALAAVMPVAVAALLIALVYAAIAGVMAMSGRTKIKQVAPAPPQQTVESIKEDVRWLKGQRT